MHTKCPSQSHGRRFRRHELPCLVLIPFLLQPHNIFCSGVSGVFRSSFIAFGAFGHAACVKMPSFAIEVEGQASPLSRHALLATLSSSLSSHQNLKTSSQQLQNWESLNEFYSLLQDIYTDFALPQEVRFQAIIQLKNGIDKRWRKHSNHAIPKAERERIRSRAVEVGVQEPIPALALQNALLLAKIVRFDFPQDWPDVFTVLIDHLRSAPQNLSEHRYTSNVLVITLQVIKELASGRLQRTKRSLQQVSSELLQVLGSLYITLVSKWTSSVAHIDMELARSSHSALKTLRRLLVTGFEHQHREPEVKQLWSMLQEHQQVFWGLRNANEDVQVVAIKHLLQLSKLYLEMARQHPASFVLLGSMEILHRSWAIIGEVSTKTALDANFDWEVYRDGDDMEDSPTDKLALKALLLFRACVKMVFQPALTFRYQSPADKDDRKLATDTIKTQVFTDSFVIEIMELVVTKYFVLRPSDLRDWEAEPDEWERREEEITDAWEFSIRSCSEKLFLDLVINFKELLVPRLLQVFQQYATLDNTNVLLKDSLYAAIGISAACLDDVLDFNTFLRSTLVPEVQMSQPGYNLLRRRVAIVLGQWVPIKPDEIDRVAVYQIFTYLLSSEDPLNDHVVRVTAGRQLRMVLEPFEFSYEAFAPYATPLLSSIMMLTSATELSETKMALLETVRVAVTKLEGHIEPYAEGIMSMLPPLWAQSGDEHLMKQAILTMITAIVNSLREKSIVYHGAVLPLIHDSVDPSSEAAVYLLEEALELWKAILIQTPSRDPAPSTDLLTLAASLLPLLEMGSELLQQIFEIIESYTVLSPTTILAPTFLTPLTTSMKNLLPMLASNRARDASLAPHVLENLAATLSVATYFDESTTQEAAKYLFETLLNTGYLQEVLSIIKAAYNYHQDPRPNLRPPDVIGPGETSLFTLLSRLALLSPHLFVRAVNSSDSNALNWLVEEWIASFDSIGDVLRKKLQTLGLTALLASSSPPPTVMLDQLQSLLTVWTDLIVELSEEAAEEAQGDYLWYHDKPAETPEWADSTPEDTRKRIVSNNDPIYSTNIRFFIAERLRHVMNNWPGGQAGFEQEWLSRIDTVVMKSFVDLKVL